MSTFLRPSTAVWLAPLIVGLAHCSSSPDPALPDVSRPDAATDVLPDAEQDAPAAPLSAESGFVELPAQATSFQAQSRLFYSFRPAETAGAESKPLIVFFNGGPGAATSTSLLAYGTGPLTLDPPGVGDDMPHANDRSFARFANLLYIDARHIGFSYDFGAEGSREGDCSEFATEDAVDVLRVVFQFLRDHPALRRSRIVIAGESYGGTRAVAMTNLLLHYSEPSVPLPDDLRSAIQAQFDAFWPGPSGRTHQAADIGRDFVELVLIQPFFSQSQLDIQSTIIGNDPYVSGIDFTKNSRNDVRETRDWETRLDGRAMRALANETSSQTLLGFDLSLAPQILPAARRNGFRLPRAIFNQETEGLFRQRWGELNADDGYLLDRTIVCLGINPTNTGNRSVAWLPDVLRYARMFITNARYDANIYASALPLLFDSIGLSATVDREPRASVARPGWVRINLPAVGSALEKVVEVRFPSYEDSGHMVAVQQGGDLADDVAAWLAAR